MQYKFNPNNMKKMQTVVVAVVAAGALFVAILFAFVTSDDAPQQQRVENNIKHHSLVNEQDMVKTKWIGDVATDIDITKEKLVETQKENKELKGELSEIKEMLKKLDEKREQEAQNKTQISDQGQPSSPFVNGLYKNFPMPPGSKPPSPFQATNNEGGSGFLEPQKQTTKVLQPIQDNLNVFEIKKKSDEPKESKESKEPTEYLPTGSITKVTLLSGFDAPTMAQAKTNPLPILMQLTDMSVLPNKYRYDLRDCFVLGEGYGDLSSERVYIRTTALSCMTNTGKHVDMEFKAMVSGEDGKIGLKGEVVTKQGSLLARTLIAGFLQGVGEAFNQSQQFTIMGGTGTTTGTQDMDTLTSMKYGAFGGASQAAEKLAEFYLKMADQISPVIEISAGREVDLITTGLTKFEILEEQEVKNEEKK
ncbi:MAG: TraB/VirB10 family protein [Sulfurimonadaceae bacterium]|jgi:conjugal transfer pilus assembly protein TraB